jgi:hypothetical protein
MAIQDLALAVRILRLARAQGLGAELPYSDPNSCRWHEKTLTQLRAGCKNATYRPVSA